MITMSDAPTVKQNSATIGIHGVGIGLRSVHYGHILETHPDIPWFEVISENFMGLPSVSSEVSHSKTGAETAGRTGGRPFEILEKIRREYPVSMHGVSLNIGSADPLNESYVKALASLARRIEPAFVSDHLCWTGVKGENLHDLLPLPFTVEVLDHVAKRVDRVQEVIGRPLILENVSSYITFRHSVMTEWEFLSELSQRTGCGILLDVNNVFVSAKNHRFDPLEFLQGLPVNSVKQMHLAGYIEEGPLLIDTHDHPISQPVWNLYAKAIQRFGNVPTLIEWDENIPPFETLVAEAARATEIQEARHD